MEEGLTIMIKKKQITKLLRVWPDIEDYLSQYNNAREYKRARDFLDQISTVCKQIQLQSLSLS